MLYSKPCEYAIRATAYLARQAGERLVPAVEISRAERIPVPFLARILYQLAHGGLLASRKGPGGGFRLARPARRIRLREIVALIDGLEGLQQCNVGLPRCSDASPCAVHDMWKDVRRRIADYLERITLADMARATGNHRAGRAARG
jgi:Rrf2 family protein